MYRYLSRFHCKACILSVFSSRLIALVSWNIHASPNVSLHWSPAYRLYKKIPGPSASWYLWIEPLDEWNRLDLSVLRLIFTVTYKHSVFPAREIYLELISFAVKPMFWFSIWTNQIAGNYISSSGCGPDCLRLFVAPRATNYLCRRK